MISRPSSTRVACGAALLALLAGCALGPPPLPEQGALSATAPLSTPVADAGQAPAFPDVGWWRGYGDATLDELIARALGGAPGLASAEARFGAAQENVRVAGASVGVKIDGEASYQRLRLSETGLLPPEFLGFTQYGQADVGIRARFDLDWWGRRKALIDSANDHALAARAESQSAALALASGIAESWFGWQADAARIALLDQRLETLAGSEHIARRRESAGLDRGDGTESYVREQATVRELRAQLEGSQQLHRVQIAALLGVAPDALPPFESHPLPVVEPHWPANAGLDLIARRPDIAASRWRVEAARRDLDVVRTEYYPNLSINALVGLSSIEPETLFKGASGVPSLGIALHLPFYDGLRDARHNVAAAQLTSAIARYNETVVDAAREVSLSAASLTQSGAQRRQREQVLAAASESLRMANVRAQTGLTDLRPELDARLALLREKDLKILLDQAALIADIQLQEALGGGYSYTAETQ
jgi:outer membrane protein, multidrug efflux system